MKKQMLILFLGLFLIGMIGMVVGVDYNCSRVEDCPAPSCASYANESSYCPGAPDCINQTCVYGTGNWSNTCKNLYWFDDDSKECGYKQFCGAYMYKGLQTFNNKDECERKVIKDEITPLYPNSTTCEKDSDCPVISCAEGSYCPGYKCEDGRCVSEDDEIKEKITCKFQNTNNEQKCYVAGMFNEDRHCKGEEICTIEVKGYSGEKFTWKSSCGGYQYTTQDGNDETIYFKCDEGESNITEIKNKGFRYAYWNCYNEKEWKANGENCLSSELWQKKAKNFCNGECKGEKCGVNSFSLGEECYLDEEKYIICNPGEDIQTCCLSWAKENNLVIPACFGGWNIEEDKCIFSCKEDSEFSDDTLICRDACALDGKCYPTNNRKNGKYCSVDGSFISQLEDDAVCDNNFECKSNVCVSGKCLSSGLLQKILDWFKNLFG